MYSSRMSSILSIEYQIYTELNPKMNNIMMKKNENRYITLSDCVTK